MANSVIKRSLKSSFLDPYTQWRTPSDRSYHRNWRHMGELHQREFMQRTIWRSCVGKAKNPRTSNNSHLYPFSARETVLNSSWEQSHRLSSVKTLPQGVSVDVCAYVHVCRYVCVHVFICIYVYIRVCRCVYMCVQVHMWVWMSIQKGACVCVCLHTGGRSQSFSSCSLTHQIQQETRS